MRNTGRFEMQSVVGQEEVAGLMIRARMQAEQAMTRYHENRSKENFEAWKDALNRLHRLTLTKWSATGNVDAPDCLFSEGDDGERRMKTFLDDLTASEMQKTMDRMAQLYEKLNLHGNMKERAGDVGMGGKSAAEKAAKKAGKRTE